MIDGSSSSRAAELKEILGLMEEQPLLTQRQILVLVNKKVKFGVRRIKLVFVVFGFQICLKILY